MTKGSVTEQQKDFAHITVGEEDRPGVMLSPKGGEQLDADWYKIVPRGTRDWVELDIYTESGTLICTAQEEKQATILIEALNMRAEHYALRAYGRIHGKLPTQQALQATENLLKLKEKELADTQALVKRIKAEARKEVAKVVHRLNVAHRHSQGFYKAWQISTCQHARRYSRFVEWELKHIAHPVWRQYMTEALTEYEVIKLRHRGKKDDSHIPDQP